MVGNVARSGIVLVSAEKGANMKARNSVRSLKQKPGSIVVRRRGRTFVINKRDPRWNTRQG
jgi:large subunit ribosomal protein L36